MSRLVLPQIEEKRGGVAVARPFDAGTLDRAFDRIAATLNGNLGEENLASGVTLSVNAPGGLAVPNAFAEPCQFLVLSGTYHGLASATLDEFLLGAVPTTGAWEVVSVSGICHFNGASGPTGYSTLSLYGGATLLWSGNSENLNPVYAFTKVWDADLPAPTSVAAGTLLRAAYTRPVGNAPELMRVFAVLRGKHVS